MRCDFLPLDDSSRPHWKCTGCGFQTETGFENPPWRICAPAPKQADLPSHLEYLACKHRGATLTLISGAVAGCGCHAIEAEVHHCRYFNEPVLKYAAARCLDKIKAKVPGYAGRTCRECVVPTRQSEPARNVVIPSPAAKMPVRSPGTRGRGILTGASAIHWPCLGALAIAAANQGIGFAVADHGLKDWQRATLERAGVLWVEHERPGLDDVKSRHKFSSDIKAWWKPWICLAAPFELTAWVDSDAVVTGDLSGLFEQAGQSPCVSTQRLWQPDGSALYRGVVDGLLGTEASRDVMPRFAQLNSGVVAWRRNEPLIREWRDWCLRIMTDEHLSPLCRVRDQTGLLVAVVARAMRGDPLPTLLEDRYNTPADYLRSGLSKNRLPIRLDPGGLLADATSRHPGAVVVHWLGGLKPWKIK